MSRHEDTTTDALAALMTTLVKATTGLAAIAADREYDYHATIESLTWNLWLTDDGIYRRDPGPEPEFVRACGHCYEDDICPDDYEPDWDAIYPEPTAGATPYVETDADVWYANNYAEIERDRYLDYHARNDLAEMDAREAQQHADADAALNGLEPGYGLWTSENHAERNGTLLPGHRRTCPQCGDWNTHLHPPYDSNGPRCTYCGGSGYDPDEQVREGDAPEDPCGRCVAGMKIRYTICTVIDAPTIRAHPDDPFQVAAHRNRR